MAQAEDQHDVDDGVKPENAAVLQQHHVLPTQLRLL